MFRHLTTLLTGSRYSKNMPILLPLKNRIEKSLVTILIGLFLAPSLYAFEQLPPEILWSKLRSGDHFVLIRHALAPGTGDPDNFIIDQRSTQRNLSEEGINQAKAIGGLFRSEGIKSAEVFSSQWFRCLETAELLDLGSVNELTALNSFFRDFEKKPASTNALKQWIANKPLDKPVILVTHQVNITALTGVYPSSGGIVFVAVGADKSIRVIGTIDTL